MRKPSAPARKPIVVAGDEYPSEMVKEKLLRITASHIEYVFDCLKQNTTYVRNIKNTCWRRCSTRPAPSEATIPPSSTTICTATDCAADERRLPLAFIQSRTKEG